jgi:peptide/nickel transport system substrate-binding protein
LNVKLVDWSTWLSETYLARNFQATVIGLDAKTMTARSLLSFFVSDADNNFINFSSDDYDETFAEAISATDDAQQVELYGPPSGDILSEDAASVYLQDLCDLVAMGNGLEGYEFYPLYVMDLSKVYFTA